MRWMTVLVVLAVVGQLAAADLTPRPPLRQRRGGAATQPARGDSPSPPAERGLGGEVARRVPLAEPTTGSASRPTLTFNAILGDTRGCGLDNLSVAVTDRGTIYLLQRTGRVLEFNRDGQYQRSRQLALSWPNDGYSLAAEGERVFLGNLPGDYPWAVDPRRTGSEPGRFNHPRCIAQDDRQQVYVADTGNRRVQVFAPGNATPLAVWPQPAAPLALAVRGTTLAVVSDDQQARLYRLGDGAPALLAAGRVDAYPRACALAPTGELLVVANGGWNGHGLRRYRIDGALFKPAATIAPAAMDQWPALFPAAVPLSVAPDGQVWFATDITGALISVDPATNSARERARGLHRPLAVNFDDAGTAYVTGSPRGAQGPEVVVLPPGGGPAQPYFQGQSPLHGDIPFWGLLPLGDGSLLIRQVEDGWNKGWPALTLARVWPDGRVQPFCDFGPLYAKWRRFHPWSMAYSLRRDAEQNVILAALPLVAVVKLSAAGKLLWRAGPQPVGGADAVGFQAPRDVSLDSRGNLWVIDGELDRLFCLSPAGRLLFSYGVHATVDDRQGAGFDGPTGVAVTRAGGHEYLYVGDAGNQRLVRYELSYSAAP